MMGFEELIKVAGQNGIWALMFISFFVYFLKRIDKKELENKKTNDERETRYIKTIEKNQEVICNLSEALKSIDDISDDVKKIKGCLEREGSL